MKAVTIICILLSCLFCVRVIARVDDLGLNQIVVILETSDDSRMRSDAARALRHSKYKDNSLALAALARRLEVESSSVAREYIATALLRNGGEAGQNKLIHIAKDSNSPAQGDALAALDESHDPRVTQVFLKALRDPNKNIKLEAARGLDSRSKEVGVYPALAAYIMSEDNSLVQEYVARGIEKSGHPEAVNLLIDALEHPTSGSKKYVASSLASIKNPLAIEPLIEASKKNDQDAMVAIVRALSEFKSEPKVITRLIEIYENENSSSLTKEYALRGMLRSDDARIRKFALESLKLARDGYMKGYALELLAQQGEIQDIASIAPLLKSESGYVRRLAYNAIQKIMENRVDEKTAQAMLACLPLAQQVPISDSTLKVTALFDIFLLGMGGFTTAASKTKIIEIPMADENMVQAIITFIESIPEQSKVPAQMATTTLDPTSQSLN